jgi:predicted nucleic acid-binding protein
LVLDAEGVSKAGANDPSMQLWLERARELDADVVLSAVTLAEVIRDVPRDAGLNRVVKAADVWPADEPLARRAGGLLGAAGSAATIDALVAATALTACDRYGSAQCVVLTNDPDDLAALLTDEPAVRVIAV